MMSLTHRQYSGNVLSGILHILDSDYTSQQNLLRRVRDARRNDAGTIDEVDALHQDDVLPYLRLAGYGRGLADFLLSERVDDGGLAGVGVADEADGDLFAGGVESRELAEQRDESTFAKGVRETCVEGEGGVGFVEVSDPPCLNEFVSIRSLLYNDCSAANVTGCMSDH